MTDVTLNGTALSTACPEALVTRVGRPLVGRRRDVFVDVPGRRGSYVFTEQPGDRTITVALDLLGDTFDDRRAAVRAVADWAEVGEVATLIVDDEPDRYHEAILADDPDVDEWLISGRLELQFRAGPYALALNASTEELCGGAGGSYSESFTAPIGIEVDPVIVVTGIGGGLTGFDLHLNGDTLSVDGTFAEDQPVTITSDTATVTSGQTVAVDFVTLDPLTLTPVEASGVFPVVLPGGNAVAIEWTGTATSICVHITYRERYR